MKIRIYLNCVCIYFFKHQHLNADKKITFCTPMQLWCHFDIFNNCDWRILPQSVSYSIHSALPILNMTNIINHIYMFFTKHLKTPWPILSYFKTCIDKFNYKSTDICENELIRYIDKIITMHDTLDIEN